MCSGPFRGAQGHSNFADAHREKGPHGLEAWRSGISSQSLQTTGLLHCATTEVRRSAPLWFLGLRFASNSGTLDGNPDTVQSCTFLFKVTHHCIIQSFLNPQSEFGTLFKVTHLGGAGAGAGGWVLLGSTGLVLPGTTQNPARLVYGRLRSWLPSGEQQSHFATLPIITAS